METGDCYLRVAPPSVRSRRIRHVEVLLCVAFGCVEIHFVVHFLTWFPRDGHLIFIEWLFPNASRLKRRNHAVVPARELHMLGALRHVSIPRRGEG